MHWREVWGLFLRTLDESSGISEPSFSTTVSQIMPVHAIAAARVPL
jgi:hypothetical protein